MCFRSLAIFSLMIGSWPNCAPAAEPAQSPAPAASQNLSDDSIQSFLRENFAHRNAGMVVGILDEHGPRFFAAGKLDNGTDTEVNADTLFEIGSATKTFTALLLLEMADRGEVKLDDPVAKYLSDSVELPAHDGKEITLANLAAQDSGLPFNADNHKGADWAEKFRTYTVENMYDFLGRFQLPQDPGQKFQYSNIGMGLLAHALSQRAGQSFESLVVNRICQPLGMDSTCITLSPELKNRLATGHDESGKQAENFYLPAIPGAGALRSTANDLAKYVAAQLGLTETKLGPLMVESHRIRHDDSHLRDEPFVSHTAMPWYDDGVWMPAESQLMGHAGGTAGYNSFIGFDLKQRFGVVVLTNQSNIHSMAVGWRILQHARLEGLDAVKMQPIREMAGLGVALAVDNATGALLINHVFPGSPASKAGIADGAHVQTINGIATKGKPLGDCVALLRGMEGTAIKLELADAEGHEPKTVDVMRAKFILDE